MSDTSATKTPEKSVTAAAKKSKTTVTKKKTEAAATKKKTGEKPEPTHPKYAVMIADIVKNCENTRAGISRAGILKALLELPYGLGGQENEKKNRVNALMKRSLKKSVEAGTLKMAAVEGKKGSGHYKPTDKKSHKKVKTAGADGEAKAKTVKKTSTTKSMSKSSADRKSVV